jgi:uncharacterized GH25 family protein
MKALIARYSLLATACCVIFTSSSRAHEFIIKPATLCVNAGDNVPFSVLSTHVFMSGEELLSANFVKASLLEGNKSVDLPLKENDILQTLDGTATGKFSKTLIVVEASDRSYEKVLGHRLEIVPNTDPTAARISMCSKPSWFFLWNSAGLKFGFGPETV